MEPSTTGTGSKFPLPMIMGGAAIVIAIGAFAFFGNDRSPNAGPGMMREGGAERSSLKGLLSMGSSQKCTFDESNEMSRSNGTFYAAGGKGRGDFESTVVSGPGAGTKTMTHMIVDGEIFYVWDDTSGQGMKLMMNDMPGNQEGTGASQSEEITRQWNEAYAYDCAPWSADQSLFNPPANISFVDMNQMMGGMMNNAGGGPSPMMGEGAPQGMDMEAIKAAQCSACDQAGPQKDQCRAALGC